MHPSPVRPFRKDTMAFLRLVLFAASFAVFQYGGLLRDPNHMDYSDYNLRRTMVVLQIILQGQS